MKKQSIFGALMSLVAMGVVFVSCTNVDNPYTPATPEAKYVVVKDSVVGSNGSVRVSSVELDAEGKAVKETLTYYNEDGTADQNVGVYTYGRDLITYELTQSDGTTSTANFWLNDKGLVERYEDASYGVDVRFGYSDDGHVEKISTDDYADSFVWQNGDVISRTYGDLFASYILTDYEIDFPFLMPYDIYDIVLSQYGYFGKATRHLISKLFYEVEDENGYESGSQSFEYVVRNGLVKEFTNTIENVFTENGANESVIYIEHHYLTWKKL